MDEEGECELSDEERRKAIEDIRNGLPYITRECGEAPEEVAKAKAELASLERALREAKPYKTHRAQLEKKKERLERQHEKVKEESQELQEEIKRLQEQPTATDKANAEREVAIASVDEELRELLKRAIAEGDGEQSQQQKLAQVPGHSPAEAWQTVTTTLADMAAQPGVPQAWATQLGSLLDQIQRAAEVMHQQAAAQQQQQQQLPP